MKVFYHGEEIELESNIEQGEKELDKLTIDKEENDKIDLEDTKEIAEEMLKKIIQGEKNE